MWKEAVLAQFKVLLWHLYRWTEENLGELRKAGLQTEVWTCDFPNKKQEYTLMNGHLKWEFFRSRTPYFISWRVYWCLYENLAMLQVGLTRGGDVFYVYEKFGHTDPIRVWFASCHWTDFWSIVFVLASWHGFEAEAVIIFKNSVRTSEKTQRVSVATIIWFIAV